MNRWSWEWNQQGDKAEIAMCSGGKQETPVPGLQGEDGTAKIRAETKAVLRVQGRAEVSTVNYGKRDPHFKCWEQTDGSEWGMHGIQLRARAQVSFPGDPFGGLCVGP